MRIYAIGITALLMLTPVMFPGPAAAEYKVIGKAEMKSLRGEPGADGTDGYDCRYYLYLVDECTEKEAKVKVSREIWEQFQIGGHIKGLAFTADSGQQ